MARINLIFFWRIGLHLFDNFICISNIAVQNVGFAKEKCSGKRKKKFHVKSAMLGFIKNVLNSQEKILNQLVSTNLIIFVTLAFVTMSSSLMLIDLQKTIKI